MPSPVSPTVPPGTPPGAPRRRKHPATAGVERAGASGVTVVTGAGSGLGRALAVALAGTGRTPVLVGRRRDRLAETEAACRLAGADDCLVLPGDLTHPGVPAQVVARCLAVYGRIDALVNNAGLARFAPLERTDRDDLTRMLLTNHVAPAELIRHAVPALRRSRGCVVNVASIGGLLALPGRAHYGSSKAALIHLTRSLARELAPEIRVNAVAPGAIDTEMYDDLGMAPAEVARLREDLVRTTPLGRTGTTADVVPWIELLLGPAGQWVTGSLIVIDGGRSC